MELSSCHVYAYCINCGICVDSLYRQTHLSSKPRVTTEVSVKILYDVDTRVEHHHYDREKSME